MKPQDWSQASESLLSKIQGVCLDIDDTLSTQGKLTSEAYSALWKLKEAGFFVIPVTGRPAGWCDHIARFWPVDAVVGENGAFTFYMENGIRKRIDTPSQPRVDEAKRKLDVLSEKILLQFPEAKWASDQKYREYDLAVDFCEDVPRWEPSRVQELISFAKKEGAHVKLSSIHVNLWFGDYDKRKGIEFWLSSGAPGLKAPAPPFEELLFIGDSPNDEPLFECFPNSVGVANLKSFLDQIEHPPKWMTSKESGSGFVQMAERLIASRA